MNCLPNLSVKIAWSIVFERSDASTVRARKNVMCRKDSIECCKGVAVMMDVHNTLITTIVKT